MSDKSTRRGGGRIFVSYRRGDDAVWATLLRETLRKYLPKTPVFMDVASLGAGDSLKLIRDSVATADVFIAVIGPGWLDCKDAKSGQRRLDNPVDWVRLELRVALDLDKALIPVLINETPVPAAEDLPEDLRRLTDRNFVRLRHDRWDDDVHDLIVPAIQKIVGQPAKSRRLLVVGVLSLAAVIVIIVAFRFMNGANKPGYFAASTEAPAAEAAPVQVPMQGTVTLVSEPGDFIGEGKTLKFTNADGKFSASLNKQGDVSISYRSDDSWSLDFSPPEGQRLAVGNYLNASRAAFHSPVKPGLDVSGAGRGCNTLTGAFNVRRIEYAKDGESIRSFAADLEQHCEGAKPELLGAVDLSAGGD
jgi:TIR domain-containing protein